MIEKGESVEDVDKARKNAVELMKTISSVDDIKENKDKILDMIEEIFKTGGAELKRFIEGSPNMDPEEARKKAELFQDDEFLMNEELKVEFMRVDSLPGAIDYIDTFNSEMEERINPHMEEFVKDMEKVMMSMMGDLM